MLNKKIVSVLAVTLMLTMGVGITFVGNDESEGTSTETSMGNLNISIADMITAYNNGVTSYTLAINSVVNIDWNNNAADYIQITSSTYTDNAGLTADLNNRYVKGMIDKDTSGTVQVTCTRSSPSASIVVSLNIIDMSSTQSEPWTVFSIPSSAFLGWGDQKTMYIKTGTVVDVPATTQTYENATISYSNSTVTSGFGLTVSAGALSGTVSTAGAITVTGTQTIGSVSQTRTVTLIAVEVQHADVRMIGGETWTYTPAVNMTAVLSISGTATSWVSLSGGVVSGTAPTNTAIGQTYDLMITADTTDPNQTATQTVTFTVDPQITATASSASQTITSGTGSVDIISSNFEDGTRAIYSITAGPSGYTVNATSGVISYSNPTDGTVTVTATSPYTYTSGNTNTATAQVTFTVVDTLTASVSGTLYLVTGMTVPNTPAEAVTLSHNDIGSGTYTWSIVGTNASGVTVASDGTIGGTPGAVGTYALTVRCTSVVGGETQTADATLNVVIVAVLVFTSHPSSGTVE